MNPNPNHRELHPDLANTALSGLFDSRNEAMEGNIGRFIRLRNEPPQKPYGMTGDLRHRVIAVQKIHTGELGYRAVIDDPAWSHVDAFGRAVSVGNIAEWLPLPQFSSAAAYLVVLCRERAAADPARQYDPRTITLDDFAHVLAVNFCQVLADWLTTAELEIVRARNAAQDNPSICHSHDFCDANEAMLQALTRLCLTVRFEGDPAEGTFDPYADQFNRLWNSAWNRAKAVGFDRAQLEK